VKGAWLRGSATFAVKVATTFYDLPRTHKLPSGTGAVLLLDAQTGAVKAVLADEGWLTDVRTAAAGSLCARLGLDRRRARSKDQQAGHQQQGRGGAGGNNTPLRAAVLGAGMQARLQMEALRHGLGGCGHRLEDVRVWARDPEKAAAFARGFGARACPTVEDAVRDADVVLTCTPSLQPLIRDPRALAPDATIVAVGSDTPGKRELDASVLRAAKAVVADSEAQCRELGELQGLDDVQCVTVGNVVRGHVQLPERGLVVFDLTGVGAQDAAIAEMAWEALRRDGAAAAAPALVGGTSRL
jgi:ornithine cyclodeaminase